MKNEHIAIDKAFMLDSSVSHESLDYYLSYGKGIYLNRPGHELHDRTRSTAYTSQLLPRKPADAGGLWILLRELRCMLRLR